MQMANHGLDSLGLIGSWEFLSYQISVVTLKRRRRAMTQSSETPHVIKRDEPRMGVFSMASIYASMLREMEGKGRAAPDFEQALHVQEVV